MSASRGKTSLQPTAVAGLAPPHHNPKFSVLQFLKMYFDSRFAASLTRVLSGRTR